MLDLESKYKVLVCDILAHIVPGKTVWAYGSRVKGNAHAGSDLDLVVIGVKEEVSQEQMAALRHAFSESNLPILVDVFDWTTIPEIFKQEIKEIHEVLQ